MPLPLFVVERRRSPLAGTAAGCRPCESSVLGIALDGQIRVGCISRASDLTLHHAFQSLDDFEQDRPEHVRLVRSERASHNSRCRKPS